tara:strand:- start:2114 stop:3244 length:1131 start_codon:yes stop_codon:yes gene_type:complete
MKISLTFILSVSIIFISSCASTGNKKNIVETNDKSKDFISNQINTFENKEISNIVSKLYKLKKLNEAERDLINFSLKNGSINGSYVNDIEKLLNAQKIHSSNLKLKISTSEKNKEMLIESLIEEDTLFNISFEGDGLYEISDNVLDSNLKFYCKSFIAEQKDSLEKKLFKDEKILIIYSSKYESYVNFLMSKHSEHIYLKINRNNYEEKIQKIFEINNSNKNALLISNLNRSLKIEHSPRLRNDLKKIYFIVGYDEGKSLAPFLKSFSTDLMLFSSSVIFHEADELNDLSDFEKISVPISKNFISMAYNNKYENLEKQFENILIEDYLTIEKAHQNNIFNSKLLLNTGPTRINKGECINRNMTFWAIDVSSFTNQS